MKKLFILLLVILCALNYEAQSAIKDTTIVFNGQSRKISIYIPNSYDPSTPAKLIIGLHGMGDNSNNYRSALASRLPESLLPNTIIICPDGGNDAARDFYTPAGDEAIIQRAIDLAFDTYNIDPNQIVLQGFSLGGRSALKYGLDNPDKFRGLLLNTPAIQGMKEALMKYSEGGLFQYSNADKLAIYVTHGTEDVFYASPIDSMVVQLIKNDGKVRQRRYNMGHDIPTLSNMKDYIPFMESLYLSEYDLDIIEFSGYRHYSSPIPASVLVQNKGSQPLTKINFKYTIGENTGEYLWNGSLAPFQHEYISIPVVVESDGNHTITVEVDYLNNNIEDTITYYNEVVGDFQLVSNKKLLPYEESFDEESSMEEWTLIESGDFICPAFYDEDVEAIFCLNNFLYFDNSGMKAELISPLYDLKNLSNMILEFDVAYNYTKYTANYNVFGVDTVFADTLQIFISTDYGLNYTSVYKKGGADLLTYDEILLNPLQITDFYMFPEAGDWRKEEIDLTSHIENDAAILKFSYISGHGGIIYLDNISVKGEYDEDGGDNNVEFSNINSLKVFPNPVIDILTIKSDEDQIKTVNLFDTLGREMLKKECNNQSLVQINTSMLNEGIYFLEVTYENNKIATQKIFVQR